MGIVNFVVFCVAKCYLFLAEEVIQTKRKIDRDRERDIFQTKTNYRCFYEVELYAKRFPYSDDST